MYCQFSICESGSRGYTSSNIEGPLIVLVDGSWLQPIDNCFDSKQESRRMSRGKKYIEEIKATLGFTIRVAVS